MRVDVVSASAGTGKTYRLTEELVRVAPSLGIALDVPWADLPAEARERVEFLKHEIEHNGGHVRRRHPGKLHPRKRTI